MTMITYGPVPSRRLGRSLGVNNIPPKVCSYSCVYCQLGSVGGTFASRKSFYSPEKIVSEVLSKPRESFDYVSFVPDGEPTLDLNLGEAIREIKKQGLKVAVITNSSLISREDVRSDLALADYVSLSVDAVSEDVWRKINRPHSSLDLEEILSGIEEFSKEYKGTLTTETMLVKDLNDDPGEIEKIAEFVSGIKPGIAYISIPTRPPAEKIEPPGAEAVNQAYQIFAGKKIKTELLTGYEGDAFASTGDVRADILSITSVHPMRRQAVAKLLTENQEGWSLIEGMVSEGEILELKYQGRKYYMRALFGKR